MKRQLNNTMVLNITVKQAFSLSEKWKQQLFIIFSAEKYEKQAWLCKCLNLKNNRKKLFCAVICRQADILAKSKFRVKKIYFFISGY